MRITRVLAEIAANSASVYKIVFTALLLYELVRYGFKRNRYAEAPYHDPGSCGNRAPGCPGPALGEKK